MSARPSRVYGILACASCFVPNRAHEVTGALRTDLLSWQKGRKVVGEARRDLGPRFSQQHAREQAEIRCECGASSWSLAPQAIEDAKAKNEGRDLRELPALEDLPIQEDLKG